MKKIHKLIAKATANPVFNGLPDALKDPKNYLKTERKIVATMVSDHKHTTMKAFINCKRCQAKVVKKAEMIKDLGFKDYEQYANWRKIMWIIINEQNLTLYDKTTT